MTYDHSRKAGNQGDVVKHVALFAVVDSLLRNSFAKHEFHYADTFAGYAFSPLIRGNEWSEGIGKLFPIDDSNGNGVASPLVRLRQNPHTKLWYEWYLEGRPRLLGGVYPGSSLIVQDLIALHRKTPRLSLWDTSPSVIANLMENYGGLGYEIFPRPARPDEAAICNADLLFIDPPTATNKPKLGYPLWSDLVEFFQYSQKQLIVWLPVSVRIEKGRNDLPKREVEDTLAQREDAIKRGLCVTVVRFKRGVRNIGCQLFYRLPDSTKIAMREALDTVVDAIGWNDEPHDKNRTIQHFG